MPGVAQKSIHPSYPTMIAQSVSKAESHRTIEAESRSIPRCPACGTTSGRRQAWYPRTLRDLPARGVPAIIRLQTGKWRCLAPNCDRPIFAERLPRPGHSACSSGRCHRRDPGDDGPRRRRGISRRLLAPWHHGERRCGTAPPQARRESAWLFNAAKRLDYEGWFGHMANYVAHV